MVTYIRSDLDFILEQINIAEAHSRYIANPNDPTGALLYGVGQAGQQGSVPAYNVAWGLRTVDGSYNHLLPGQEHWGASDRPFAELVPSVFRTIMVDPDGDGPMGPMPVAYTPSVDNDGPGPAVPGDVFDPYVRQISNLLVDQTLANPAAILVALDRAGAEGEPLAILAEIQAAYNPLKPLFNARDAAERAYAVAKAAADASPSNVELQDAADAALLAVEAAQAAIDADPGATALFALLDTHGIELEGSNIKITNLAPDEGLSASFNSWFTLFGQFFDHGLDLVNKGGSGVVFIPLLPDDPLFDPDSDTNFMVLTRATTDGATTSNTTTAYVDQNQTYTSHPSHQVFLRQYVLDASGDPVATGKLIEGTNGADGGMATWGEVKAQAQAMLGINLTDADVGSVPLMRTDPYGNFIPGSGGFPQVIFGIGVDGIPNTADDIVVEGNPAANGGLGISLVGSIRTSHAFLADIAHEAVPDGVADGDLEIGLNNPGFETGDYDNELLDAHFVAGDGRVNENIGLTAVHHVFHAEHNRLVDHTKETVLATGDIAFINEWLAVDITTIPANTSTLIWDGERLFQAAKFGTEMQYQHLVFEEFARKVQPAINTFLVPDGFDTTMDPTIVAEFAHVVYRFGHSMLTESIDSFSTTFEDQSISLIQGFLNPTAFNGSDGLIDDEIAAGSIIRGMTRQVGNEIDEFVTSALRNNLLGLPLDLATINLARGRDTGVPTLNAARASFYEATNQDIRLKPYESWVDFAGNLKNESSIINFIASYGTHSLITSAQTLQEKRDAALSLITGTAFGHVVIADQVAFDADRLDFLNAAGIYAGGSLGGLNNIDLWIGGLAEQTMPFGGMLGSTFNFVFEIQMEKLQSGDRFYYLQRLDGLHLFGEMENNSFAAMIMRNTDATHLPSDVFSTPGLILEVDRTRQYNDLNGDGVLENDVDPTGGGLLTQVVVRNNPATVGTDTNYLRYTGDEHVVMGGTEGDDIITASIGDDTLFGDGGNDRLEGGFGNDIINGGAGDDIITDNGGDDNIKAGDGNDVVHAGPGLDLVLGGRGNDFIFLGTDEGSEVFAGEGDDFIYGNKNAERILGNEGNDWIETGTFDGAPGDNFDEIFAKDGIDGHDVFLGDGAFDEFIGEGGDDIMVGSPGRGKMVGMSGWDWATYKDNTAGVNADLSRAIVFDENPTPPQDAALDGYEAIEGLSGSRFNDILTGSNTLAEERVPFTPGGTGAEGYRGSRLTKESLQLIVGLDAVMGLTAAQVTAMAAGQVVYSEGDIILGGGGSDVIKGMAGDDIIDGNKWLDVNIAVYADATHTGTPVLYKSMTQLAQQMFSGAINPNRLAILREIKLDTTAGDIDTAEFQGDRGEYAFSATADGQVTVTHAIEDSLDGTDRLSNIEKIQFATGNALNIILGTPGNDVLNGTSNDDLMLGLAGADTLNGGAGNDVLVGGAGASTVGYADNFETQSHTNSNGADAWPDDWDESGDSGGVTTGQIRVDAGNSNLMQFVGGTGGDFNGAQIERTVNLNGATGGSLSYSVTHTGLEADDNVTVSFSRNGTTFVPVDVITNTSVAGVRSIDLSLFGTGPFTANAIIRFVATSLETGELVTIDSLAITGTGLNSGVDTLNGGVGDDTYSFTLGDGNDVINEGIAEGTGDRISILSTVIDPLSLLPVLSNLDAVDNDGDTDDGSLVITYNGQQVTVNGHFNDGAAAQTGVELIDFNGATVYGYLLGSDDYFVNKADPGNRNAGGVNMAASAVTNNRQNFIAGEAGTSDIIFGGALNDLIFGGNGTNRLNGGDGDDLMVGGADADNFDGGSENDDPAAEALALGADTMVGLGGNDTYHVDDVLDVVVEATGQGTDTVQTLMAALSIEGFANVENLTYTGLDADPFVGTGNAGNNTITGGDLADTLSGLGGADTLQGGLGADTMIGGDGNDVYFVDETGDVVTETNAALVTGGTDRVESDVNYTLGANLENLDLNGAALIGNGNSSDNVINGNDEANQLFGGGGNDTLGGDDGDDLLDGGAGNDILNGGNDDDTIIGGAGNDAIDVGGGFNRLVYNITGFGNDTVTSFDAAGGTATTQDLIDVSALGLTAANIGTTAASRIQLTDVEDGATDDTLITIRDANNLVIGTITLDELDVTNISATDFTLATPTTSTINGTNAGQTINGVANNSETINALGGNDTVNAGNGNDVVNGGEGADTLNGDAGNDTLSGGIGSDVGTILDNFNTASYSNSNGTVPFPGTWAETSDGTSSPNNGDIDINGNRLRFNQNVDGGEIITRAVNLAGATAVTLSFAYEDDNLGAGQSVIVEAFNVVTNSWEILTGGTLGSTTGNGNGTFNATLSANQIGANSAIRFRTTGDGNNWDNGDNFYVDNFTLNVTRPGQNVGVDAVNGGVGDDTIIWNANVSGPTDGRDLVDGGTEGLIGDTFVINGNVGAEAYGIYTRTAWSSLGNSLAGLNAQTEIIIARNGTTNDAVIAELREIEEIRINGTDPSGPAGTAGDDTFTIAGDFSATSLRLSTLTIEGSGADDTLDISELTSSHRVVFHANGGNDTVLGTPRPQDVIEGAYTIEESGSPAMPPVTPPASADPMELVGDRKANVLIGGTGDDVLNGKGGSDTLDGGAGDDVMAGGNGDDTFVFSAGFGNDRITDFDANSRGGQDLIDISDLEITSQNFATMVVIENLGSSTLVTIGENSMLFDDVTGKGNNMITQSDFLLG